MDKTLLTCLQKLLRQRNTYVRVNARLQAYANELGVGRRVGDVLYFSQQELDRIETALSRELGGQVRAMDLQASDRMTMATQARDEKLARSGVFESLLTVARAQGLPIPLVNGMTLVTPEGVSINLRSEQLDLQRLTGLLVVENGSLLTHWPDWVGLLPAECQQALIVYRGHGINQRLLQSLLRNLPESTNVYGFFDFDPAGVNMLQHLHLLRPLTAVVPVDWSRLHQHPAIKHINKPEDFTRQREQLAYLVPQNDLAQELAEIYNYLMAHKLAITQEHLVTQTMKLKTLSMNASANLS
ncbi:hypothetical protein ABHF91_01230 [Pseudaeromonas sp. ZJS20]|uniref:DUF7281 domain-containing protein n=1 Tax=Pseudaeromonas aegiceratis TaxID=3153928 RepID=UPI00390C59C9